MARAVAAAAGVRWTPATAGHLRLTEVEPVAVPDPPRSSPELLGQAYEALLGTPARKAGAHYTPAATAAGLTLAALDLLRPAAGPRPRRCATRRWAAARSCSPRRRGSPPRVSPRAPSCAITCGAPTSTPARWRRPRPRWRSGRRSQAAPACSARPAPTWPKATCCWPAPAYREGGAPPFDAVIGNPPFQSQLGRPTARSRPVATLLQQALDGRVAGYTDTAALFLVAATQLSAAGAVVALVQPASFLASRDTHAVRAFLAERAPPVGLWMAGEAVFTAKVSVCAPVLRVGGRLPATIRRWTGRAAAPAAPVRLDAAARETVATAASWTPLARGLGGAPVAPPLLRHRATLGERCRATAGFRDEYYGIGPFVGEVAAGEPDVSPYPLVTCGLIDPGVVHWGRRPARYGRRTYTAPAVDVDRLRAESPASPLARWVGGRLRPKVVVATQTRVIEAAVDTAGAWVPSVPVVSVDADPDDLWLVAAALLAPPVSAWALDRVGGTALADGAIKLAARHVHEVPAPADAARWAEAAAALRVVAAAADDGTWRRDLGRFARAATRAYGLAADDPVVGWWQGRLPPWARAVRSPDGHRVELRRRLRGRRGRHARRAGPDPGRPRRDLAASSTAAANALAADLLDAGLGQQAKVAAYLYNGPEYLETYFAAFKAGLAPVNTNYRYGPEEILYLFDNADAEAVVFHASFTRAARDDPRTGCRECGAGTSVADGRRPSRSGRCRTRPSCAGGADRVTRRGAAPATTSCCSTPGGTTGMPKGVMWRQDDLFKVLGGGGNAVSASRRADDLERAAPSRVGARRSSMLPACPLMHGTGQFSRVHHAARRRRGRARSRRAASTPPSCGDRRSDEGSNAIVIVGDAFAEPMLARARGRPPATYDLSKLVHHHLVGRDVEPRDQAGPAPPHPAAYAHRLVRLVRSRRHGRVGSAAGAAAETAQFQLGERVRCSPRTGGAVEPGSDEVGHGRGRRLHPARLLQGRGEVGAHVPR